MHPLHNNKYEKLGYIILINTIYFVMEIFIDIKITSL